MIFWLIAALMTVAALALVLLPLVRSHRRAPRRMEFDLAIYRDQLHELESDQARGLIGTEQSDAARLEIQRRMLAVSKKDSAPAEAAAAGGGAEEVEKPTHDNFEDAFTDYFCEFILSRLEPFHLEESEAPFPYVLNPAFSEALEKAIRDQVLPDILSHRRVRGLADSVSQENLHKRFFFAEFSKDEEDNVVRLLWTNAMRDFAAVIYSADQAAEVSDKKAKKKKRGFFKKKDATPPQKSVSNRGAKAEAFWKTLSDGAKEHGYDAPKPEDMDLFEALMDYKLADIDENKTAIRQLLIQEKAPVDDDHGREGATRDHLYKLVDRMVPHCGELITLWAYHAYRDIFRADILRSFIAGQGTSDDQRKRKIPMFWRWCEDDIRAAMARDDEDE